MKYVVFFVGVDSYVELYALCGRRESVDSVKDSGCYDELVWLGVDLKQMDSNNCSYLTLASRLPEHDVDQQDSGSQQPQGNVNWVDDTTAGFH